MSFIVKNTTLPSIFDLLAPHSCRCCEALGEPLCNRCKNNILEHRQNFCPTCKTPNPNGICNKCNHPSPIFVGGLRSAPVGALTEDFKFHSIHSLAKHLASILDSILPFYKATTYILPLPTNPHHIRGRGMDHTLLITKHLARLRSPSLQLQKALIRNNNAVQVGSSKKQRLAQAETAYSLNPTFTSNPNATYILFDDIWTTGASINAASKKLQQAGVNADNIVYLLLAVS